METHVRLQPAEHSGWSMVRSYQRRWIDINRTIAASYNSRLRPIAYFSLIYRGLQLEQPCTFNGDFDDGLGAESEGGDEGDGDISVVCADCFDVAETGAEKWSENV